MTESEVKLAVEALKWMTRLDLDTGGNFSHEPPKSRGVVLFQDLEKAVGMSLDWDRMDTEWVNQGNVRCSDCGLCLEDDDVHECGECGKFLCKFCVVSRERPVCTDETVTWDLFCSDCDDTNEKQVEYLANAEPAGEA